MYASFEECFENFQLSTSAFESQIIVNKTELHKQTIS